MLSTSRKRALVLSGGGGRGAYHVGVLRAGPPQDVGVAGMPLHRTQVQPVPKVAQQLGLLIDHRDVIGLAGQIICHRSADLAGAQDDDLHLARCSQF